MIELWTTDRLISPVLYLNDALPSMKYVILLQIITSIVCAMMAVKSIRDGFGRKYLLLIGILIQSFQYLYYTAYVDEVYVNLEHSWNLYHFGRFSFSPVTMVDGTVELFYYSILAPFAWSHLSLIYACITLGLAISLLHTLLIWYFVRRYSLLIQLIVVIGFAWNPIFAEIQSSGFGNGIVSLLYLCGLVSIWENRWRLANAAAIAMPLLRPDAVVFSLFLIIAMALKTKKIPFAAILGTVISVGTLMVIVRFLYDHWILTPVMFKKTPLNEIVGGVRTQIIVTIYGLNDQYTMIVMALLIITTLPILKQFRPAIDLTGKTIIRTQFLLMFALFIFYTFTNRNFFAETRRYYLPFEYMGFLIVLSEWGMPYICDRLLNHQENSEPQAEQPKFDTRSYIVVMLLIISIWSINSATNRWKSRIGRFSDRTNSIVAWLTEREDSFSVQAAMSQELIPQSWRIATTELQGYGFLLDHEIDPLFGYANRRMALSKTIAKRGTKTDVNYLFDSKPEVIWLAKHKLIIFPSQVKPGKQHHMFSELQTDFGFNLTSLLEMYPNIFIVQAVSSKGYLVQASYFVRSGLEDDFRKFMRDHQYEKAGDIAIDLNIINQWVEKNPF